MSANASHENSISLIKSLVKLPFTISYTKTGNISVRCGSISDHHDLIKGLKSESVNRAFHTFTVAGETDIKSVIYGLPRMGTESILEDLRGQGLTPNKVIMLASPEAKNPTVPYLILFAKGTPILEIKKIRYVCYCKVTINKYKKAAKNVTQCYRCQEFGHAAKNCNWEPKCVRCSGKHDSRSCPTKMIAEAPAKCSGCNGNHVASSKECPKRLKYIESLRTKKDSVTTIQKAMNILTEDKPKQKIFSPKEFPSLPKPKSNPWFRPVPMTSSPKPAAAEPASPPSFPPLNAEIPTGKKTSKDMMIILRIIMEMKSRVTSNMSKMEMAFIVVEYLDKFYDD